MNLNRILAASAILPLPLAALAAPADFPANAKGLHLQTNLGSFKIKRGNDQPDQGVLDIKFTGTVLVSDLVGTVTPGPGVKLEYNRPDMRKQVFHGAGTLHVDGKFGGILFFGRDMNALYNGTGIIQLYGEFDKNLNTGFYWYGNNLQKNYWGTSGNQVLPVYVSRTAPEQQIKVKDVGGKG